MLRIRNIEVTFITGDNGALAANEVEVLAAGGSELLQQSAAKSMVEGINNPKTRRLVAVRTPAPAFSQTRVRARKTCLFVFVGRVEPDKGVRELIAAAAQAKVPLMIIGDGPLREPLAAQHPEVVFTGWKTRDEIGALVMPTRFREPFGMVALEAAQSGLPVIVAQSALLAREAVENGLGFACDIHDRGAFAAGLARVRDMDSGALRAISEREHSREAQLCLSPDDWVDRLIALYDSATGRAR